MPQNSPSAVGIDEVRKKYKQFFAMVKFDVKFYIIEVIRTAPRGGFCAYLIQGHYQIHI